MSARGRRRVGIVTCRELPEPDPDRDLLLDALDAAGMQAELVAWDAVDPARTAAFEQLVIRSSWNYHLRPAAFLTWLESAGRLTRLRNPLALVRWNLHKRYLAELAASGVSVVPTEFVERGERPSIDRILARRGWTDIVMKPAVSASSWRTFRFRIPEEEPLADAALRDLAQRGDALVQPYIEEVERSGERAVMWIDGAITHAVRKSPRFSGADERVSDALEVSARERKIVEQAVAAAIDATGCTPLYARIDLMPRSGEGPMVSELEFIEPSLFLRQSPAALGRFVRAIATAPAS